ncbi:hypothetical protein HY641_02700 [Candidatus Woesearchaeota archaeon]|nr:hypothetical protein [Candidatus Woesearchaeota archaeon]
MQREPAQFHDISDLAEDIDEPSGWLKAGMILSGLVALVDAAALVAKVDLGKKIPFKWWFLWLVFVIAAGLFFYFLNKRRNAPTPQPKPDTVDLSHMNLESAKREEPPVLDLPIEKSKKMDRRAADAWDVVQEWQPQPSSKDYTYQDQLFGKLKKTLLSKYMVTPEYKRLHGGKKPDILIDRDIAVIATDATPDVVEKIYKRLQSMRVEYKHIIVILFDRGRVPSSQIDRVMHESMTDLKELVAYRVVKP